MAPKSTSRETWEIMEVRFKPDISMEESYGYLDIVINDNDYVLEEVPFDSEADEIDWEELADYLEQELEEEDFKTLNEEDFEAIAKECSNDLSNWN